MLADKAEEREQLLEKKIAQLQEDLERLDAENHNLLEANKHLNEDKLKVEPMVHADKAEEREQLLVKKIALLQEDLERLDAENHHLLRENKHLNEEKLKVKPEMRAMLERIALIMKEEFDKQKQTMMEENMTWKRLMEEYKVIADELIVRSTKFRQTIKEMEAKAEVDKTKMMDLQKKVKDLDKYDSRKDNAYLRFKEVGKREG